MGCGPVRRAGDVHQPGDEQGQDDRGQQHGQVDGPLDARDAGQVEAEVAVQVAMQPRRQQEPGRAHIGGGCEWLRPRARRTGWPGHEQEGNAATECEGLEQGGYEEEWDEILRRDDRVRCVRPDETLLGNAIERGRTADVWL